MNEEINNNFVVLVEKAAQIRGDMAISREFIEKALVAIKSGEISVAQYPTGYPSLKAVYDAAFGFMPKQ